jgi:hypothetical protein
MVGARSKKRKRKRPQLDRRVASVAATAVMAAGGFFSAYLPAAHSGGHVAVTGPAACVVFRVAH